MKTITEKINESIFNKKSTHKPAFNSSDQQWDNWCGEIISNLVGSFEHYKKEHPEYNPQTDSYPEDFDKEVIKYANDKYDFFDTLYCLYQCYYNGDFTKDDIGGFMPKVKFNK